MASSIESSDPGAPRPNAQFTTTQWSVVLHAGDSPNPESESALAELCRNYWYPLYAYVRHRGHAAEDARDLTQAFFHRLLERKLLKRVKREGGKFRSYLLTALKHFLSDEWDRARAQKRGGGQSLISLDYESGQKRYAAEPVETRSPDQLYERRWALAILDKAMVQLRQDYQKMDKEALFETIQEFLPRGRSTPYSEIAEKLSMTESNVKVAVHRLRNRYRKRLREEVSQTLAEGEDAEAEIRHLFAALAGE
jgi:RNA polymerase sigma factor (sigma-70 family)